MLVLVLVLSLGLVLVLVLVLWISEILEKRLHRAACEKELVGLMKIDGVQDCCEEGDKKDFKRDVAKYDGEVEAQHVPFKAELKKLREERERKRAAAAAENPPDAKAKGRGKGRGKKGKGAGKSSISQPIKNIPAGNISLDDGRRFLPPGYALRRDLFHARWKVLNTAAEWMTSHAWQKAGGPRVAMIRTLRSAWRHYVDELGGHDCDISNLFDEALLADA